MRKYGWIFILWLLVSDHLFGAESMQRYRFTHTSMSIDLTILAYASDSTIASEAATAAFARIDQLDGILSDYNPESELRRLCDTAGSGTWVPVSDDLWYVLQRSIEFSEWTDGAFDITAAPAIRLWRRSRTSQALPSPERMTEALKLVGWHNIELNTTNQTVRLKIHGMRLDVGGIAKGYIVAEALKSLREHGVHSALLSAGGDVGVSDPPPGKDGEYGGWILGVAPLTATQGVNRVQAAYREISDLSAEDVAQLERQSHTTDSLATTDQAEANAQNDSTDEVCVHVNTSVNAPAHVPANPIHTSDTLTESVFTTTTEQRPSHYVVVANCFAATSGDAFQFVIINGIRYSHILNPRTGQAVTTPCSVSLIGQDAVATDALATTMNVLGPEAGIKLLDQYNRQSSPQSPIAAHFLWSNSLETNDFTSTSTAEDPSAMSIHHLHNDAWDTLHCLEPRAR